MTVALVRSLIPDKPLADSVTAEGDASTVRFNLPYFPVKTSSYYVYVSGTLKTEGSDYSLDKDAGVLTFVTPPAADAQVRIDYQHTLLSDDDIDAFLALHDNNPKLAAAEAIGVIASNQVLVLKVVRILDTQVDGAAVSRELRQRQKQLRDEALDDSGEDGFAIAEMAVDSFSSRQILRNRAMRGGL